MYRKTMTICMAVALAFMLVPVSGAADDARTAEEALEAREQFDPQLEPLETKPLSALFAENPLALLSLEKGPTGQDAGCQAAGTFSWAEAGTPAAPCSFSSHNFGITHTGINCLESACSADALESSTFDFILVSCDAGSFGVVDWAEGTLFGVGSCETSGDGTAFTNWDSLGGGGTWSHTDNAVDGLVNALGL